MKSLSEKGGRLFRVTGAQMGDPPPGFPVRARTFVVPILVLWTLAAAALIWQVYRRADLLAARYAILDARESVDKDALYRRWAAGHGGVYAPVTAENPPNPYLAGIPERDITTPSGRRLTLMHPAYMTRQVFELGEREGTGSFGHITSLNSLRPENAPDPWEKEALRALGQGAKEVSSVEQVRGQPHLRLMSSVVTEASCLGCHAKQGYKAGDVRGGISISVPMRPFLATAHAEAGWIALAYGLIWLAGAAAILLLGTNLRRRIAERRQAEEELRESEGLLRLSQGVARIGHYMLDVPAGVWSSSETLDEIFGIGQEHARTVEGWLSLVHPDQREEMRGYLIDSVLRDREPFHRDYRIVRASDGAVRCVHGTGRLELAADGRPVRMFGVIQDVTERRQAEAELQESETRLRDLMFSMADWVWEVDENGVYTFSSQKGYDYFGAAVIGKTPFDFMPPDEAKRSAAIFAEIVADKARIKDLENWNIRENGERVCLLTNGVPILDKQGNLRGYRGVDKDITERKRAEEERERLTEEKARLEAQLRQSQKMEAIGTLAGGVAHDFNNLTAIVLGYGEMLMGRLRPEDPARKWAEQIVEAGQRAAVLTHQLLAFGRRQTLQPEVLDLNALLRNLEKMLGRLIGENIEMELSLAADLGRVKADRGQIEQVVANLVLNARDAMPVGGRLTVETANAELDETYALEHESVVPGSYVMLALTDTGIGMDRATVAQIFEPFFTTKERGKGTGLGLATVFGVVKQSGGNIWATSETGKGTVIKVFLPRTDAEREAKAVVANGEVPRGSGQRILLVEDEASLRELCETTLSRLGYRVSVAGNGPEALALVQQRALEPDLVLTDVIMPGMSGAELAARLRRDRPGLGLLYMSGYPDDAIASHGVLDPGTPFIQKPFTARALAEKVREALAGMAVPARPGRSVLMIDDDEQFRELVQYFCTEGGHVFAGVDSSAAALEALAAQSFDVLLVDLNIPGTNGARVLREIRAAGHAAPAIVLTGDVASADMAVLRPLGAVGALEKSSSAEPLLKAIEDAVAATSGGGSRPCPRPPSRA